MDLQMLFGGIFLSLLNALDDEGRERAIDMISHFSERETFSPSEREVFRTMIKMADDVFLRAAERKSDRDRSHLRVIN
jgi:hypothetical protein